MGSRVLRRVAVAHKPATQRPSVLQYAVRTYATAGGDAPDESKPAPPQKDVKTDPKEAAKEERLSKPMKNLRDVMEALDILVEEAEKKMEKKYRPNMFAEFKQLNDTNGKVLEGAPELISVDKAAKVPSLQVKSLSDVSAVMDIEQLVTGSGGDAKKVTLLVTSFKNYGLHMLPAWRDPFLETFKGQRDHVQVLSLNIIEEWYMKLVQSSILRGLKQQTPEDLHHATLAHFGRCDDFRTVLDLNNSFVCYVHLIDSKGRIRWIAGGPATPVELQRLTKLTKELLTQQQPQRRR
ncbi:hypothetical protein Poli38472_008590 [Pythium oligandrum]|uniref:Mitochondrial ATPase complex subunit ATP10 n=1 Tax=Pythium oligandrum TaxID=41045 RepID=A0A8K1C3S7_PYTOL|nr:hypothetical protein Poli38472_008590 [Pythium oligandrum]|eukprot:TMW55942.1 hypothetical protein Poli38472_008590 [Pythium oligandrum]